MYPSLLTLSGCVPADAMGEYLEVTGNQFCIRNIQAAHFIPFELRGEITHQFLRDKMEIVVGRATYLSDGRVTNYFEPGIKFALLVPCAQRGIRARIYIGRACI